MHKNVHARNRQAVTPSLTIPSLGAEEYAQDTYYRHAPTITHTHPPLTLCLVFLSILCRRIRYGCAAIHTEKERQGADVCARTKLIKTGHRQIGFNYIYFNRMGVHA